MGDLFLLVCAFCLIFFVFSLSSIEIRTGMSEYHEYTASQKGVPVGVYDELSSDERAVLFDFLARLHEAEKKHPVFAEGPYEALGRIGEEQGELVRAVTKNEGDERIYDEALDLLVVTWRLARGDWRQ